MTSDNGHGVRPSLTAEGLISAVPVLDAIAEIQAETLATKPGASLDFADVGRALAAARRAAEGGAAGVVIVQGTDTIEETAYLLDLYWGRDEPIVVTGAMRAPQTPGADGPANLVASVRVACSPSSRNLGVIVVLNDEVHAASRVRKMRASGTDAFESGSFAQLGFVEEGAVVYGNRPNRWSNIPESTLLVPPRVALLEASLGDDGELLEMVSEGAFDGAVIAGFGVGHLSSSAAMALERTAQIIPVVLASRTAAGTTYTDTYDFPGSEKDLLAKGAIPAGWLDPRKARILLIALLSAGCDAGTIFSEFVRRGGSPGGGEHTLSHKQLR